MWLALIASASAAEPRGVDVVLRGLVERWEEPSLSAVYASGVWAGGLGFVAPVVGPIDVDVELAFARLSSDSGSTFEVAPLSLLGEFGAPLGPARVFGGLGPTLTVFTESPEQGTGVVSGSRLAFELRGGLRADTGFVKPPMAPAVGGPVKAVDVELYVARRSQLPVGGTDGFHLGAWRACVGLGLSF